MRKHLASLRKLLFEFATRPFFNPRATQMDSGPMHAEESSARGPQGGEELSKTQTIRRDVDAQR